MNKYVCTKLKMYTIVITEAVFNSTFPYYIWGFMGTH